MKKRREFGENSNTYSFQPSKRNCSTPISRLQYDFTQHYASNAKQCVSLKSIYGRVISDLTNLTPLVIEESHSP